MRSLTKHRPSFKRQLALSGAIVLALLVGDGIFLVLKWPFKREKVIASLEHSAWSRVRIKRFHQIFFPSPGYVGEDLTFERDSDGHATQLASVHTLKCYASWSTILVLTHRVKELRMEGLHVYIPARVPPPIQLHPAGVIEPTVTELIADGANLEIAPRQDGGHPLRFDFPKLVIGNVAKNKSMTFRTVMHNPEPPGNLTTSGTFGPFEVGKTGQTPVFGSFDLTQADLSHFHVISGMLLSHGSFHGTLAHLEVKGKAAVSNFEIISSHHDVGLSGEFSVGVDREQGTVSIHSAAVHFLDTTVRAEGSISGMPGQQQGKIIALDLTTPHGRVEDLLRLVVKADPAPLYGPITFQAHVILPSGREKFLRRVRLRGQFNIRDAYFSRPATQQKVNELSKRARKKNKRKRDERAVVDLKGDVSLRRGIALLSNASFQVPGATARGRGTYNLLTEVVQLHGGLAMQARLSQAAGGIKSLFLLPLDPFFQKEGAGAVLPFRVTGTYSYPSFTISLTGKK
jgi:hypothetical protein